MPPPFKYLNILSFCFCFEFCFSVIVIFFFLCFVCSCMLRTVWPARSSSNPFCKISKLASVKWYVLCCLLYFPFLGLAHCFVFLLSDKKERFLLPVFTYFISCAVINTCNSMTLITVSFLFCSCTFAVFYCRSVSLRVAWTLGSPAVTWSACCRPFPSRCRPSWVAPKSANGSVHVQTGTIAYVNVNVPAKHVNIDASSDRYCKGHRNHRC
jgi:hypothetical protein